MWGGALEKGAGRTPRASNGLMMVSLLGRAPGGKGRECRGRSPPWSWGVASLLFPGSCWGQRGVASRARPTELAGGAGGATATGSKDHTRTAHGPELRGPPHKCWAPPRPRRELLWPRAEEGGGTTSAFWEAPRGHSPKGRSVTDSQPTPSPGPSWSHEAPGEDGYDATLVS